VIYHFCPEADWKAAESTGEYTAESLASQGFIHCSPRDHVHVSATERARGRTDLVVLEIDEEALPTRAVWEEGDPPHPTGMLFPHVYAAIPTTAVTQVIPLPPTETGAFLPLT
jgi:uncharacterized protein (DUF952 family)